MATTTAGGNSNTISSVTSDGAKSIASSPRKRCVKSTKQVMFVLALCVTVLLFTLPVVFYYVTAYTDLTTPEEVSSGPPPYNVSGNDTIACDMLSSLLVETNKTEPESVVHCKPYTGAICTVYLTQLNQCIVPGNQQSEVNIAIKTGKAQDILEDELIEFQSLLVSYPECQTVAVPFLCPYYFPLAATTSCQSQDVPQLVYTSTQEECIRIRDGVCAVPWQLAVRFGLGDGLPDCLSLPQSNISQDTTTVSNVTEFPSANSNSDFENITCKDDFILEDNTCFPRCDRFEAYRPDKVKLLVTTEIIASIFGTSMSFLIVVLSIHYRKNMFKFPAVFVVFYSINYFFIGIIFLVLAFDRIGLSCSSINLIEALANPTLFCSLSGATLQYLSVNTAILWFSHLSVFFYKTMFPFHAHRLKQSGKTKYLAAVLIIIALLVPLPGVIVALTVSEHHYRFARFPPTVCVTDHHAWFYSTNLIFTIIVGTGTCLLITILWLIYQNRSSNEERTGKKQKITNAEKKIISVFIIFIVFGVFSMIHYGLVSGNTEKATRDFTNYFLCESTGHVPGKCDRSEFERHLRPEMSIVTYYLLGIIPMGILNFVVNWSKQWKSIKQKLQAIRKIGRRSCIRKSNGAANDSTATNSTTNNSTASSEQSTSSQLTVPPIIIITHTGEVPGSSSIIKIV